MNILTLDLATMTGYALGHPPEHLSRLRSNQFSVSPQPSIDDAVEDLAQRALNLEAFLLDIFAFKAAWPDLVVYEAPWSASAESRVDGARNPMSVALPIVLAAKVVEFCKVRNVRFVKTSPEAWRKAFIGKARAGKDANGKREDIKRLVIDRCEEWEYLPPKTPKSQNNRADAIGIWHWAQIYYGKWQPPHELMFGQKLIAVRS